ncbi:MAG: helix-turn-helix domain-containing protein [Steroidobacteraceae bacterium]
MNLAVIGRLIAERRRARGLTLSELAASAGLGRSTLAALEAEKLPELGFAKVARLCSALGLALETRATELDEPLMRHRHLTEQAGRDLTKAAIADVIERGDIAAWRGMARAINASRGGSLARRVREVLAGLDQDDVKVRAFATLLPGIVKERRAHAGKHG